MDPKIEVFAVSLAKQAGKIIKKNFTLGMTKQWKADNTPLTITDITINKLVLDTIHEEYPDHSILAEEQSTLSDSEYTWVCDPVDGTMPFSNGIPTSVFSLALTKNGKSIAGVVYDPFLDRLYYAELGKSTTLNGKRINVNKTNTLKNAFVDIEGLNKPTHDYLELFPNLERSGMKVTIFKSIIYPTMLIAAGEYTASIFGYNSPWDAAAVKIIVEEAGGKVTDLFGNEQRYDQQIKGFIASNGLVHDRLVSLVKSSIRRSQSAGTGWVV